MYDIIIIGAGPAGLTSAIYAKRANKSVLVLEAKTYGGQIVNTACIDNYPALPHISGIEFATNLYNQTKDLGVDIKFEKVVDFELTNELKTVITTSNRYECKSIIIATGADKRKLGIDREEEFTGKGVSYCATCDGMFFKGKEVAVVGGGNTALEEAKYLSSICSKVYLIHRRDEFRGNESEVNLLKDLGNIEFVLNSNVTKLLGNNFLEGIEVTNKLGNAYNISVSALFVAVGQVPETTNIVGKINTDNNGYIIADESTRTNIDGIFVAGDVRTKDLRQLTTAVSDGAQAATMACKYVNSK